MPVWAKCTEKLLSTIRNSKLSVHGINNKSESSLTDEFTIQKAVDNNGTLQRNGQTIDSIPQSLRVIYGD